jgi:hypothetical protein
MADAAAFVGVLVAVLWVALAVAVAVFAVALLGRVLGPLVAWLEPRILPRVARRARVAHGLPPDAPRWACRACRSVNEPAAAACYHCGAPAAAVADSLPDRTVGELWQAPVPPSRFDPSLYRGPGAPPDPGALAAREAGANPGDPAEQAAEPGPIASGPRS